MNNQSIVDLMTEYYDVIDEVFGFYLDTVYGYNYLLKQFNKVQEETSKMLDFSVSHLDTLPMSYGEGDPNEKASQVFHYTTQGEFKSRIDKNGISYIKIGQLCISQIYQYWEDHYRTKVAEIYGRNKNDIKLDIFGDLRLIRNSIIHHRGIALDEIVKCKKIRLFNPGEIIAFTQDNIIDIVGIVKLDLTELSDNYCR